METKLNQNEIRVLENLVATTNEFGQGMFSTYTKLAANSGITVYQLKKIIAKFQQMGILGYILQLRAKLNSYNVDIKKANELLGVKEENIEEKEEAKYNANFVEVIEPVLCEMKNDGLANEEELDNIRENLNMYSVRIVIINLCYELKFMEDIDYATLGYDPQTPNGHDWGNWEDACHSYFGHGAVYDYIFEGFLNRHFDMDWELHKIVGYPDKRWVENRFLQMIEDYVEDYKFFDADSANDVIKAMEKYSKSFPQTGFDCFGYEPSLLYEMVDEISEEAENYEEECKKIREMFICLPVEDEFKKRIDRIKEKLEKSDYTRIIGDVIHTGDNYFCAALDTESKEEALEIYKEVSKIADTSALDDICEDDEKAGGMLMFDIQDRDSNVTVYVNYKQ